MNPVDIAQQLIRIPTITPCTDMACPNLLAGMLEDLGFSVRHFAETNQDGQPVRSIFATIGSGQPHFLFSGHFDVVPPGDETHWRHDPFGAHIEDDILYGRGAVDMKGEVACAIAAAGHFLKETPDFKGTLSFLLTGDEEIGGFHGAQPLVAQLWHEGIHFDDALVIEPSSFDKLADTCKIGARGIAKHNLTVKGVAAHAAYPASGVNAAHKLNKVLQRLIETPFDEGNEYFEPTNLQVTDVSVSYPIWNVLPEEAYALLQMRYSDYWNWHTLEERLREMIDLPENEYTLEGVHIARPFLCKSDTFRQTVSNAVNSVLGYAPKGLTTGGSSDGRYLAPYCNVIEIGLFNHSMHHIDEYVPLADLYTMTEIYGNILNGYFQQK